MIIAVDANEANIKNRVGIGRFASNVLNGLYQINARKTDPIDFHILLKSAPLPHMPGPSLKWRYQVLSPAFLWSQLALPAYLMFTKSTPRLLFSTSHYSPKLNFIPSIISVMDLSYLYFPQMFKHTDLYKLKYWTAMSVKKAKKIITISNFSKNEIVKYYGIDSDKIIVVYPGVDGKIYKPKRTLGKKDYILYVGTLQPRKNIIGLIDAFSQVKLKNKLHLKIVGQKGWLYQNIFDEVKKRGLEKKIIFSDYVKEDELVSLYQNAVCLVLPSFYEGFGIPVVEAFACGCPVVAADSSSLPEIVGGAGLLIDPNVPSSIAKAIDRIYSDNNLRESLITKGLTRSKAFNWQSASQIIYKTILNTI